MPPGCDRSLVNTVQIRRKTITVFLGAQLVSDSHQHHGISWLLLQLILSSQLSPKKKKSGPNPPQSSSRYRLFGEIHKAAPIFCHDGRDGHVPHGGLLHGAFDRPPSACRSNYRVKLRTGAYGAFIHGLPMKKCGFPGLYQITKG